VGHDDEPALVGRPALVEVPGEPGDALDVEVVGRLVEEDDVPVADEQFGEGDASSLTATELPDRRFPRHVEQQAVDHVADAGVTGPFVLVLVADDRVLDHQVFWQQVGLVEHPERDAVAARDAAGIRFDAPAQQAEEGRLAVSVAPDDADSIALIEADRDLVEDDTGGIFEVKGLGAQEMCH
jgi:hypothetical protein